MRSLVISLHQTKVLPDKNSSPSGRVMFFSEVHIWKAEAFIVFKLLGNLIEVNLLQPEKAFCSKVVSAVKYCNSSNEVIVVLELNFVSILVTAAASAFENFPSPSVSQLAKQMALRWDLQTQ